MSSQSLLNEPAVPQSLDALFRSRTRDIRMLPAAAVQALEIARNPDCSITEFTSVVERDIKLATDVLSMANSALFCTGRPISTLHQSVVRLGLRQCRNIILASSFASLHHSISMHEEWIRELLRHHSFLTGMLALNVNRAVGAGFQGEEFAAALIHDIGRTLFAVCMPESFTEIDRMDFEESADTPEAETRQIGTSHCELGGWFAQNQKLPADLVDVIRFHHNPTQSLRNRRLVALIGVCDHMANHMQRTGSIEDYRIGENTAIHVLEGCGVRNAAGRLAETSIEIMRTADRDAHEMIIP